jgi:glycosyltransferase involved in cell wall biosynthesis
VLSTSGGSTKEYFGEHALYLDPASPEDISKKIAAALRRPKDAALRRHIAEHYTWERTAQETIAAYKEILGRA